MSHQEKIDELLRKIKRMDIEITRLPPRSHRTPNIYKRFRDDYDSKISETETKRPKTARGKRKKYTKKRKHKKRKSIRKK